MQCVAVYHSVLQCVLQCVFHGAAELPHMPHLRHLKLSQTTASKQPQSELQQHTTHILNTHTHLLYLLLSLSFSSSPSTRSLSHTHSLGHTQTHSLSHTLSHTHICPIYIQPQRQVSWRSSASAHAASTTFQFLLQQHTAHILSLSAHIHTYPLVPSLSLTLSLLRHAHTHTLSLTHILPIYIQPQRKVSWRSNTHSLSDTHTCSLSLSHTHSLSLTLPVYIQPQRFFLFLDTHTHTHTHTLSHTHILSLPHTPSLSHTLSIYIQPQRQVSWRSSASAHAASTPPQSELQQHSQSRRCPSRRVPLLSLFSPHSSCKALSQIHRAL